MHYACPKCCFSCLNADICFVSDQILPPKGVRKSVELSHYLSCIYSPPINCPPGSERDGGRRYPNNAGESNIAMGNMELSVATGYPTCKTFRPGCEIFLGFVPDEHTSSTQRYLAERFAILHLPKAYTRDLGAFLLR